jgi:hypothetical protein
MKSKLAFLVLAAVCFGSRAKANTVDLSATGTSFDLEAQLAVDLVTGTFWDQGSLAFFTGTEYEVTAMTGTFNGDPVSLATTGPMSYLTVLPPLSLGFISFSVNGDSGAVWDDHDGDLLLVNSPTGPLPTGGLVTHYSATIVGTPEPSSLLLLGVGGLLVTALAFVGAAAYSLLLLAVGLTGLALRRCRS